MNARKKLRAIMAGERLVLMPGAYDALSARIIEAEGFEALVAGGYAAIGSMLAQADMGQSNMRDYADHMRASVLRSSFQSTSMPTPASAE
jgi:methylisocitrate lyase